MSSLVSILMPAFNAERFISESIQSVIDQAYGHWELIIVNDGSADNTLAIITAWQQKDARIRVISNNVNRGLGFASNLALQHARGEFIAKLDADDLATSDWLSSRVEYLFKNPSVIAVSGSRLLIDEKGRRISQLYEEFLPIALSWRLIFGNPVVHPGILFRAVEGVEYSNIKYLEDWDLWSKLILKGDIEVLNDHKISYRVHSNNTSRLERDKEVFLPIIDEIIHRQLSRVTNKKLQPDILWYLFRDREPFKGDPGKLQEALLTLIELFNLFLASKNEIDKRTFRQLKLSFWDEIFHLMRLGKTDLQLILKAFRKYPLSVKDLAVDSYSRRICKKGLLLFFRNFFLR